MTGRKKRGFSRPY